MWFFTYEFKEAFFSEYFLKIVCGNCKNIYICTPQNKNEIPPYLPVGRQGSELSFESFLILERKELKLRYLYRIFLLSSVG